MYFLGVDLALLGIAIADLVLAAAMQVNRAFVALAMHLAAADRADWVVVAIDDAIRLADGAHVDQAVRLLAGGKPSVALGIL